MPKYTLHVNGRAHEVDGEPGDNLLSALRYDLGEGSDPPPGRAEGTRRLPV